MTRLAPSGDASTPFTTAFQPHGFHDACDLLVIDRAEIRITVEARSDATENTEISQVWWRAPVVPATREAEVVD